MRLRPHGPSESSRPEWPIVPRRSDREPARVPEEHGNGSDLGLTARPLDLALVVVSALLVVAGLIWPQAASMLLRLLIVGLAFGFVATRAFRTVRPVASTETIYTAFDNKAARQPARAVPEALRELERELAAANDASAAQRKSIPPSVLQTVRREAARRLADRHALSLREPDDHERIRQLVSEPTWRVIHPTDNEGRLNAHSTNRPTSVSLSELAPILEDLERL